MSRLKNVQVRRTDSLSRVGWDQLEVLLADHYRREGYSVDHVGTGATNSRFDGGIDLKLRKDDQYIVVECKHWNAKQVTHNAVHQLLGIMLTEGATGAVLVTSGEFTAYACESAAKQGRVQLIDGAALREMIGPLPEPADVMPDESSVTTASARIANSVGERLLSAAEDRIRYGRGGSRSNRARSPWEPLWKLGAAVVLFLLLGSMVRNAIVSLTQKRTSNVAPVSTQVPMPVAPEQGFVAAAAGTDGVMPDEDLIESPPIREQTPAEIRESQRKADEAMRVLEASTPEI